jgi:hypothetical protein
MNDPVIQADILCKIVDPNYQLSLSSDGYLSTEQTLELLSFPHCDLSLYINFLQQSWNISQLLANRRKLVLKQYPLFTDSFLSKENVSILRLEHFFALRNNTGLSNLQELELINCLEVTDVSCLSSLCKLTIISCPRLSDVSALGNIRWLKIHLCGNIQDITGLNNNYSLSLVHYSIGSLRNASNIWKAVYVDVDWLSSAKDIDLLHARTKFLRWHGFAISNNTLIILAKNLHTLSLST